MYTKLSLKDFIEYLISEIPKKFASNTIIHQIGEVLDTDKKKARVKKHLVNETKQLLSLYLKNL